MLDNNNCLQFQMFTCLTITIVYNLNCWPIWHQPVPDSMFKSSPQSSRRGGEVSIKAPKNKVQVKLWSQTHWSRFTTQTQYGKYNPTFVSDFQFEKPLCFQNWKQIRNPIHQSSFWNKFLSQQCWHKYFFLLLNIISWLSIFSQTAKLPKWAMGYMG